MKKLFFFIPLILILFIDINIPFVGPYGNNNSTYSLQAKNYNRFGYLKTNLAPLTNPGKELSSRPRYYLNHPPLLQVLLSFSYKVFGQENFWAGRLVPIISTVMSIFILSKIIAIFWGSKKAFLSILTASTLPMTLVYGRLIQFEPILLPFILLSLLLFIQYVKSRSGKTLLLLILTIIIGFLADWPMLYFAVLLGLLFIAQEYGLKGLTLIRIKPLSSVFFFFLMASLSLLLFIGYFFYTNNLSGETSTLTRAYLNRSFNGPPFHLPNPGLYFLKVIFLRFIVYFTPLGFIFSILFLRKLITTWSFRLKTKTPPRWQDIDLDSSDGGGFQRNFFLLLFIFPLIYVLAFPNGAWEHPYWLFYFIPFVTIASTYYIYELLKNLRDWKRILFILIIILNFVFSFFVFESKRLQVNKALWQSAFIDNIAKYTSGDKEIGVNWDFNDDLSRYRLDKNVYILWEKDYLMEYLSRNPRNWNHFVFACWANCSDQDRKYFSLIDNKYKVLWKDENALFIDLHQTASENSTATIKSRQTPSKRQVEFMSSWDGGPAKPNEAGTPPRWIMEFLNDGDSNKLNQNILSQFIKFYRKLRDDLALEQI